MKKTGKRALSIFLSLLMCLSVFALDWAGLVRLSTEADAASAGQYEFRIAVNSSNDTGGWKSESMTVYGKDTNGTGQEVQMKQATNWKVDFKGWRYNTFGLQGSGDKESDTCPGFVMNQFPTKVVYSFTIESAWADRNLEFNLYIQVKKSNGTWVSLPVSQTHTSSGQASAQSDCSGTKIHYKINSSFTLKNGSGTVTMTVNSDGYPAASSIVAGTGFENKTVTAAATGGSAVTTSAAASVRDQYGVSWYQDPQWEISSNSWGSNKVSLTNGSGGASTVITIQPTYQNSTTKTVRVKAKRGNASSTFDITVKPTYKITYDSTYNYGANDFKNSATSPITQVNGSDSSTTITVNSSSNFAAKKNNSTTAGKGEGQENTGTWTFVGWNKSASATSGTKSGNITGIGYNQTLYAIYSKKVTANVYYYDADGARQNAPSEKTAYNRTTKITFDLPDLTGTTFTSKGTTYTFKGWVRDTAEAKAADFTGTSDERYVKNGSYNYYAVYQGSIALTYDVNSIPENRVSTSAIANPDPVPHYLVANAANADQALREAKSVTIASATPVRAGMDSFLGWKKLNTTGIDLSFDARDSEDASGLCAAGSSVAITENTTMLAVYKDKRVTVNFLNHLGSAIKTEQVRFDHTATAPENPPFSTTENPDHTDDLNHYVFSYWRYADESRYQAADVFLADCNVYAVYASHQHVWDKERDQIANCTASAIFDATCTVCGYHIYEVIPAKGHDWMLDGRVEPTCLRSGNAGKAVCRACGDASYDQYFVKDGERYILADENTEGAFKADGSVVPPAGHKWIKEGEEDKIFVNAGTCTVAGYKYKKCSVCEAEEIVERLGMQPHGYNLGLETVEAVPATCTTPGHNEYSVCKDCGAYTAQPVVIPAKGHALRHYGAVPATCKMEGNIEYWVCSNCGKYFEDAAAAVEIEDDDPETVAEPKTAAEKVKLAKVPHDYQEIEAADPTCTAAGHTAGIVCTVCGDIPEGSSASETLPALGHIWQREGFEGFDTLTGEHHASETPCTEPGYTTYTCVCGETINVDDDLAGHTGEHLEAHEPTCQAEGNIEAWHCTVCGKYFTDEALTNEIDASEVFLSKTPHAWVDQEGSVAVEPTCLEPGATAAKVCEICGETKDSEEIPATGHVRQDWIETVPATCTAPGTEILVCRACREQLDEREIPAKEHTIETKPAKAATCVDEGNNEGEVCVVCGFIPEGSTYSVIAATGNHDYQLVSEQAATCGHAGKKYEACSVCGLARVTETAKLDHPADQIVGVVEAREPTCSAIGTTAGKKCAVCGTIIEAPQAIAKKAHTPVSIADVPATCTAKGVTGRVQCSVCGKMINNGTTTDVLGHTWSEWVRTDPSCTAAGSNIRECSVCHEYDIRTIAALGHQTVTDAAVPATCTETGLSEGSHCSRCGTVFVEQAETDALGHEYEAAVTEPTCTKEGYTTHTCIRCPDSYTDTSTEALGHVWVRDADRCIAATCTSTGSEAYVCERCGDRKRETVNKTDHVFASSYTAATCTEAGYVTYTCEMCGYSYTQPGEDPLGHDYVNGVCTRCGAAEPENPSDPGTTPSGNEGQELCEKCGLNHNGRTGLWKQDGIICKIVAFFRNIFKMFSR